MERTRRRLAAVMCADAVHYSRLMEADEDGTLDRLKDYRDVMSGLTSRYNGRIVNTWGDAVIIEFSSVIEAVQCAVDIQTDLASRNADLPQATRMEFRIGINLGDIMVEGDDIYGDGVNVAARLQELAPAGGITLSQSVFDQVRNKLALGFESLGAQTVRNVSEPVEAYVIRLGGKNEPCGARTADASETGAAADAGQSHVDEVLVSGINQARAWLRRQSKRVRGCVFMIGFFFLLNLVTSGLGTLWFIWPSLPFAMMLAWRLVFRQDQTAEKAVHGND
ncbi:adenylate/guanylate cyclase domain-containing protein [Roseibium litorale]|uniref:Adenylate cyclase n=1 Tax=Roseibium litorale TaxID=2803841 RepID=A0ABR9CGY5_9HYPH|nr:adenylate/guanylate cyclase domain-containing protein [Roseibium litorale]MBD8890129.1 adenylate cyclase [Roseibium litorale]